MIAEEPTYVEPATDAIIGDELQANEDAEHGISNFAVSAIVDVCNFSMQSPALVYQPNDPSEPHS
jgi:hypothetical protein